MAFMIYFFISAIIASSGFMRLRPPLLFNWQHCIQPILILAFYMYPVAK